MLALHVVTICLTALLIVFGGLIVNDPPEDKEVEQVFGIATIVVGVLVIVVSSLSI